MIEGSSFIDYYELLGIATDAEPEVIRQAFLRMAKEHHPDVGGSTEDMQQFSNAYRTLMSEKSRKAYDLMHDFHVGNSKAQYHHYGEVEGTSVDDLSDDEIDDFLDEILREHSQTQPKQSLKKKFKNFF